MQRVGRMFNNTSVVVQSYHRPSLDEIMNQTDEPGSNPSTSVKERATVCFCADSIEEKVDFSAWQTVWQRKMTFVSRDYGCGCCIHLFDLEGPKEAVEAIPPNLRTVSGWTEAGVSQAGPRRRLDLASSSARAL